MSAAFALPPSFSPFPLVLPLPPLSSPAYVAKNTRGTGATKGGLAAPPPAEHDACGRVRTENRICFPRGARRPLTLRPCWCVNSSLRPFRIITLACQSAREYKTRAARLAGLRALALCHARKCGNYGRAVGVCEKIFFKYCKKRGLALS